MKKTFLLVVCVIVAIFAIVWGVKLSEEKTAENNDFENSSQYAEESLSESSAEITPGAEIATVTFKNYDGRVLKTEVVEKGKSATAPGNPVKNGYVFIGWDNDFSNVMTDLTVTALYDTGLSPVLEVSRADSTAGDKDVEIQVIASNNPGIAGMELSVEYDDTVLSLKEVESGEALSGLTFQAPKTYKNGCNLLWYGSEPDEVVDGEIFSMNFDVSDSATPGTYPVKLVYSTGTDINLNDVEFTVVNGSITIPS